MTINTGSLPVPDPYAFAQAMEEHWTETLRNASSSALQAVWMQMGHAFGRSLMGIETKWQVLSPPTGSGKTQGTTLYCSLLAAQNLRSDLQSGVLIVTRLKVEGEGVAQAINEHVGQRVAYAHHSGKPLSSGEMREAMILVITHAALIKAFEGLTKETQSRWSDFAYWLHGKRKLVIVDEALSGIVEHNQLTRHSLGHVIGLALPYRAKHPAELQALEALYQVFEQRSEQKNSGENFMWTAAPKSELQLPPEFNLYALSKTLETSDLDGVVLGTDSPLDQRKASARLADVIRHAEAVLSRWAFYQRKGQHDTLNTALLLIPDDAPPVVVLDATATQSELWHLLGDRVSILPVPSGARSYENVTLHVSRSRGLGKHKMVDQADSRLPRLFNKLSERLSPDRKVLICLHKAVEGKAQSFKPEGRTIALAHWGAIDGRNDWQDCDAVVLFGLPYLDRAWSIGLNTAIQGIPTGSAEAEADGCLHGSLQRRQLAVSVIQALNRVRCRKVVDEDGNCAPTDAFLLLPPDQDGDAILEAVRAEMPGIQVEPWDFLPDGAKVAVRRGSQHEAILAFMHAQLPGMVYLSTLAKELGIRNLKPIRDTLNDASHALTKSLATIGVTYVRQGLGRSTKTFLLKVAA